MYVRKVVKLYFSGVRSSMQESIYYEINEKEKKISFDPRAFRGNAHSLPLSNE